jgi:peptidyl-prolyl cis-trans isomerase-like protein 2
MNYPWLGEPFKRDDILVLQDPMDLSGRDVTSYFHVKHNMKLEAEEAEEARGVQDTEVRRVMAEANKNEEERKRKMEEDGEGKDKEKKKVVMPSASFTCAGFTPIDEVAEPKITTKKGYVTLVTNAGKLNLEIHCDAIPLASENFLTLCAQGMFAVLIDRFDNWED